MRPFLFTYGPAAAPVNVPAYQVAFWFAVAVTFAVAWLLARRLGLPGGRVLVVLVAAAVALPIGARALHVLESPSLYAGADALDPFALSTARFSLMGGVLLASAVALVACRLLRLDAWRTADAVAPALALGVVIMRAGCFCGGCCFGVETSGPLGVVFPPGSPAHLLHLVQDRAGLFSASLPVHPTQLYELGVALLAGAVAAGLLTRKAPAGAAFLAAAIVFALGRWAIYPLRVQADSFASPAWLYPAIYAATALTCGGLLAWRYSVGRRRTDTRMINAVSATAATAMATNPPSHQ